jgi:hypothetical protein
VDGDGAAAEGGAVTGGGAAAAIDAVSANAAIIDPMGLFIG